jgi:TRAP-type mannitol/chloroaromatic compound transport system permease large subunit
LRFSIGWPGVVVASYNLSGAGWKKLGFKRGVYAGTTASSDSIYDFTPPPVILISIDQVFGNGVISNLYGQHIFAL